MELRPPRSTCLFGLLALLSAGSTLLGCDETIAAPPEINQAYTLWGALDPTAGVQTLRVIAIADTLSPNSALQPDVTVGSTDEATGLETAWRDTTVAYDDGSRGHLFVADMRPEYASRHRLRVTPHLGDELAVDVPVPTFVEPTIALVGLPPGDARYAIDWPGAPQINAVRLEYTILEPGCRMGIHLLPFRGDVEETETGWRMTFRLEEDSIELRNRFPRTSPLEGPPRLGLVRLRAIAEVASSTWRGLPEDRTALVQPHVFTNIENGFGFVGAAYETDLSWAPTPDEVRRTRMFFHPNRSSEC